jgi:hypothetical protein
VALMPYLWGLDRHAQNLRSLKNKCFDKYKFNKYDHPFYCAKHTWSSRIKFRL